VAVAHPDDETFGCGSLIAHATAAGVPTLVVCATRGEAGSPAPGSGIAQEELAVVRESELRDAARLLGVERVIVFDWHDSGIDGNAAAGTLAVTPLHDVAVAVGAVIDDFEPTVVITLDGSDGHRDHAHMRDATLSAVERRALPDTRLYYHCLPQSLMRRWADELHRQQPDSEYLEFAELGTPDDQITTMIDTAEHLGLREQAIATHRSQTSPYEVMPADLRADFLSVERLRRVLPAWEGGPVETAIFTATTGTS
jgi:LmbE family N-acetylglucosaminyl deacetylase